MQERTKNSTKNIIMGLLSNIIVLLLSFISRKIFINFLGVELLGINGLFSNVLQLLSLADLGFGTAMSFSFYKPLAEDNKAKIAALTSFYKKVYNIIACGIAIIGIALLTFLQYIFTTEFDIPHLQLYYLVFLTNTVVSYLFVYKSSILNATQKNYLISRWTIIVNVVKLLIQILVLFVFKNYFAYISVTIFTTLLNNLIISRIADKIFPEIKEKGILEKKEQKEIFKNLKSVFIYKISGVLLNSIDAILISKLISVAMVGYYSNYQTIISNLTQIITIIFTSLTASLGNLMLTETSKTRYRIFKTMSMVSFYLSTVVATCIFVVSDDFITIWLGEEFVLSKWVVMAISFNLFFSTSMQPLWSFREATGLYNKTKYVMLIAAILNLILSIVLGIYLGLAGIIAATVLAKISTYFWYEPHLLFKQYFDVSEIRYYIEYIVNVVLLLVCSISLNFILSQMICNNLGIWLLKCLICLIFITFIYLIIYYKSEQFKYLLSKTKELLIIKKNRT